MRRSFIPTLVAATLACMAVACASGGDTFDADPADRAHGQLVAPPDDATGAPVWRYVSRPWGFETNTWFIEGPDGLVVIDAQFLPSAIEEAVTWAERVTGKQAKLAIVLHPNPDKFNGTATLQARGVRVVTSAQVAARVPEVHALRKRWFYERYAPDYPAEPPAPEVFGDATETLEAAGLKLVAHVLGPGVSDAQVVVQHEGHLFVGDLVANGTHAWLELGHLDAWRERLIELGALAPTAIHPGRGPSGGPELLEAQHAYLDAVEARVREEAPTGDPDPKALARVREDLEARWPDYGYRAFLKIGLPAVWRAVAESSGE